MKLLIDANMSPLWETWLNQAGFEAVYWPRIGPADAPDSIIMHHAREHSYAILTFDLDFGIDLAGTHQKQPSVIQIRFPSIHAESLLQTVIEVLHKTTSNIEAGALVTIQKDRLRVRHLPIYLVAHRKPA